MKYRYVIKKGNRMKRVLFSLVFIFVFGLVLSEPTRSEETASKLDYIIHPADLIEIGVYGEEELTRELVVRPDGKVSFPLIGDIRVAGHTTSYVTSLINKKISAFIPEASCNVIVKALDSLRYYVVGEVGNPGMFNVSTTLTVLQALALAGGLQTFADQDNIIIIRGHGQNTVKIHFDYSAVKKGKKLEQNILLKRGDVLLVP